MFTAEKCKRDWPIGGKAASTDWREGGVGRRVCLCSDCKTAFGLEDKNGSPNVFGLGSVRVKGCSKKEVPLYTLNLIRNLIHTDDCLKNISQDAIDKLMISDDEHDEDFIEFCSHNHSN